MLQHCVLGHLDDAYKVMAHLWRLGYSAEDIITIMFRVCKNQDMHEWLKLEFIKVSIVQKNNFVSTLLHEVTYLHLQKFSHLCLVSACFSL